MKKTLSLILSVCLVLGIMACIPAYAADEEAITIYYDLTEISDVSELVPGQKYLLAHSAETTLNAAFLGLPEGSAIVKFGGTQINEDSAKNALPDYMVDFDLYLEHSADQYLSYAETYRDYAETYKTYAEMTDDETKAYLEKTGLIDFYTSEEFRTEYQEMYDRYMIYAQNYEEFASFIVGKIDTINNSSFRYESRQVYLDSAERSFSGAKDTFLNRFGNPKQWSNRGNYTATEKMEALFGINNPGTGFDTCAGGGVVKDTENGTWYYGCWAGGVQDLPNYRIYSFCETQVEESSVVVSLKNGVEYKKGDTPTKDMFYVTTVVGDTERFFDAFEIADIKDTDEGVTVDFNFGTTVLTINLESIHEHTDSNNDHKCDICEEVLTEHKDENNDHKCDICKEILSEHKNENNDHKCDICEEILSEHKDENNDHKCDICGETLTEHKDDNKDHKCDLCGEKLSEHKGVLVEGKPATTTSAGYRDYYECECGKRFEDEDCTVEISFFSIWTSESGNGYLPPLTEDVPDSPATGVSASGWTALAILSAIASGVCLTLGRKKDA